MTISSADKTIKAYLMNTNKYFNHPIIVFMVARQSFILIPKKKITFSRFLLKFEICIFYINCLTSLSELMMNPILRKFNTSKFHS